MQLSDVGINMYVNKMLDGFKIFCSTVVIDDNVALKLLDLPKERLTS